MADIEFDEKLADFRKSISANKNAWQQVLETNEQTSQKQFNELNDRLIEIKTKASQKETELATEIQKKQSVLSAIESEIKNLNSEIETLNRKVYEEEKVRKEEEKLRQEEINGIQKEIEQIEVDTRKRSRTREEEWETVDSKEKQLTDQIKVIQSRLREEQSHWEDILKIREQDFTALKTELEQRMKDWQTEYQKKETEVVSFRKTREDIEAHLAQLDENLSAQEIKKREEILIKQDEINTLKKEITAQETAQAEEIKEKEEAIESLKLEMEKFLAELSGGSAQA